MNVVIFHTAQSQHMRLYVVDVLEMCYGMNLVFLSN